MGKTLYIIRHSKAKDSDKGSRDIDRELTAEGLQQAARIGAYFNRKNIEIDAMLCSNATRARQSAELIADRISYNIAKIKVEEELYEASVRILENLISTFNDDWNSVAIVGHNPVLTYFVEYLTEYHFDGMEPGSVVKIASSACDWNLISQENASFEYYLSPEDLSNNNG
ncbi:MAG: phosphohistidine phosphatase SixA [Cyclobacteriaceae bacterium]|nr:phosphohistidine phosphatase SixA [Cyclobacteriaceae bacterium]